MLLWPSPARGPILEEEEESSQAVQRTFLIRELVLLGATPSVAFIRLDRIALEEAEVIGGL
jgi:hypothetical protein